MVQILQMILVAGDVCKVHYEAVKRGKKEEGACVFQAVMEGAESCQTE